MFLLCVGLENMNFFDYLRKPGSNSVKPQPLQIRREVILTEAAPVRKVLTPALPRSKGRKSPPKSGVVGQDRLYPKKPLARGHASRKRPTPEQVLESSSDASGSEEAIGVSHKKLKSSSTRELDRKRQVRSSEAFSRDNGITYPIVHAADIASLDTSISFVPLFEGLTETAEVLLQYPSISPPERYCLVKPQHGPDDFKPIEDIVEVMHKITEHYLPPAKRHLFDNESTGYPQRLSRAVKRQSEEEIRIIIEEWNDALSRFRDDGTIIKVLDSYKHLDSKLVERILTQTYSRTVSPRVSSLREYENGTDNVYGELLPKFVSDILHKDTRLKSDQVFIDLGSGVGNVVLQVALEVGCESWGCEMMKNACDLAELQREEFKSRCRLWGLAVGDINLERGNFLTNTAIAKTLQRADVVLVNNQAFTPELNEGLIRMFLDLKEGCRIVSLKSFVPAAHKITARNLNSPYNILQVEEKEYYSGCVSWTNAPGTYYVSKKDTTKIKAFIAENQ